MAQGRIGIVGAGIVGLAHAWLAAEHGCEVHVFERSHQAAGASIRNFGMIWPIGQAFDERRTIALRSRERWLRLRDEAGVWVNDCGSIHVAHHEDEWAVLEEFASFAKANAIPCELLSPSAVQQHTLAANPMGLRGGLLSPSELAVNPPAALKTIPRWLTEKYSVRFSYSTAVARIASDHTLSPHLETAAGERYPYDRIIVCSGPDIRSLFPEVFKSSGIRVCKLQMLKTLPQRTGWSIGTHLASGLTLRHYANFDVCPSLPRLRARIAEQTPELDRYGIHVMMSQNDRGEVILGDSHEYDADIAPFDSMEIEALMLRELQNAYCLPDWTISQRWHGYYAKLPSGAVWRAEPIPNVHLENGVGGAGMTMAFGLAEEAWRQWHSN